MKTKEIKYHNYVIRFLESKAFAFHSSFRNRNKKFTGSDAVEQAKNWIRDFTEFRETWDGINLPVNINFNVDFVRDIMSETQDFYCRFFHENNRIFMKVFLNPRENCIHAHDKSCASQISKGSLGTASKTCLEAAELLPNARYTLEAIDDESNLFEVVFDSVIYDSSEKYRLGVPGVSINSRRVLDN